MKFAQVGYGHDGRGGEEKGGYTYLVNDSVRSGDILTPVVRHATSKNVFVTTGKVLSKGVKTKMPDNVKQDDLTTAYRAKDLGVEQKGMSRKDYQAMAKGASLTEYITSKQGSGQQIAETPKQQRYLYAYTNANGEQMVSFNKYNTQGVQKQ